ncbi:MAG: hypothetical protein UCH28_11750, partial [Adlercreutzia sp.]|nr:hypothetical protein [Adlercreutzia sp.]
RTLAKACCASYMQNVVGMDVNDADLQAILDSAPEEPVEEEKPANVVPAVPDRQAGGGCPSSRGDHSERAFEFVTLPDATDQEA